MKLSALQREWYGKLAASGFEDIETGPHHAGLLKTDKRIDPTRVEDYDAQAEYYRRAGLFLHAHRFRSRLERDMWAMHADGRPLRDIDAELEVGNLRRVHETIARLRARMLGNPGNPGNPRGGNTGAWLKRLEAQVRRWDDDLLLTLAPTLLRALR